MTNTTEDNNVAIFPGPVQWIVARDFLPRNPGYYSKRFIWGAGENPDEQDIRDEVKFIDDFLRFIDLVSEKPADKKITINLTMSTAYTSRVMEALELPRIDYFRLPDGAVEIVASNGMDDCVKFLGEMKSYSYDGRSTDEISMTFDYSRELALRLFHAVRYALKRLSKNYPEGMNVQFGNLHFTMGVK